MCVFATSQWAQIPIFRVAYLGSCLQVQGNWNIIVEASVIFLDSLGATSLIFKSSRDGVPLKYPKSRFQETGPIWG